MSAASVDLRTALDAITNDRVLLRDHVPRIASLATQFSHSIEAIPVDHRPGFNCFAFAFGLWNQEDYLRVATAEHRASENRFFASSAFAHHLLKAGALKPVPRREIRFGDIVLYGDGARILHAAGIVDGDLVRSKWGRGHLYEHRLWEVPSRYGHIIRFYRASGHLSFPVAFAGFVESAPDWPKFAAVFLKQAAS